MNQNAEGIFSDQDDPPDDLFDVPGMSYGDDDESGAPHFDDPGSV